MVRPLFTFGSLVHLKSASSHENAPDEAKYPHLPYAMAIIHSILSLLKLSATFSTADHSFYLKTPSIFQWNALSHLSLCPRDVLPSIHLSDSIDSTQKVFYDSSKSKLLTLWYSPTVVPISVLFLLIFPLYYKLLKGLYHLYQPFYWQNLLRHLPLL